MTKSVDRLAAGMRKYKRFGEIISCIQQTQPQLIPAFLAQRQLEHPFEFSTRDRCKVLLDTSNDLTTIWHVFFANEYHVPREARTIIDLGANIGAFAVWSAHRCPYSRILSFEPFPATFERLLTNVRGNSLERRVECVRLAVSGHDGIGQFESEPGKRSYCRKLVEDPSAAETIEVECISLASLIERFSLAEIDCLKMDVEGTEYEIILSAPAERLRTARVITLEYHEGEKAPMLLAKLEDRGFQRVMHAPSGWRGMAAYERMS